MYYFKENESTIEKYKITFNEERVKELRLLIIDNCSYIVHKEQKTTHPSFFKQDGIRYRNMYSKEIGYREHQDAADEILYLVTYDEYEFPGIIEFIDKMLAGDETAALKIVSCKFKTPVDIDTLLQIKSEELDKIDNFDIKKKREKLNEIENLLIQKELNKNQKSIDYYIGELKSEIKFELVDTISKEEVERVNNFYKKLVK